MEYIKRIGTHKNNQNLYHQKSLVGEVGDSLFPTQLPAGFGRCRSQWVKSESSRGGTETKCIYDADSSTELQVFLEVVWTYQMKLRYAQDDAYHSTTHCRDRKDRHFPNRNVDEISASTQVIRGNFCLGVVFWNF